MRLSMQPRLAAVGVIAVSSITLSCSSLTLGSSVDAMTEAQQTAALALTSWVNCVTVRRVAATPGDSTNVEICADTGAKRYGASNPPPGLARPVARMRNLSPGGHVEGRWGLQPGNHYYHVWLSGPVGGPTRWTIKGQNVLVSGPFTGCGFHPADISRANFGNCRDNPMPSARSTRTRGPSEHASSDKAGHILLNPADGPAWISCREGCCTTETQAAGT